MYLKFSKEKNNEFLYCINISIKLDLCKYITLIDIIFVVKQN